MIIVLDTNVLIQVVGRKAPWRNIFSSITNGSLEIAVSPPIFLEYEEVILRLTGQSTWSKIHRILEISNELHGNIHWVTPDFRFNVIQDDPDDNAFTDCAIAASADFVITEDKHFEALNNAGYKPKPIHPSDFIEKYLAP